MRDVEKVLITGAGGYLGSRLARLYLEKTDAVLLLWVHARNEEEAAERREALEAKYRPWPGRARFFFGDLAASAPFAGMDPGGITEILHAAALIRFNIGEED